MSRILNAGRAVVLLVTLASCEDDVYSSVEPGPDYGVAALEVVSGTGQVGKVGLTMEEPLVIRAVDGSGDGVPDVPVVFRLDGSEGGLSALPNRVENEQITVTTGANGLAMAYYTPWELGSKSVLVHVADPTGRRSRTPVRITFDVAIYAIPFLKGWGICPHPYWCLDPGPMPVGTVVEWVNQDTLFHRVSSLSVPAGAEPFDSGTLKPGDHFSIVLTVAGTWTYEDRLRTDAWDTSRTIHAR